MEGGREGERVAAREVKLWPERAVVMEKRRWWREGSLENYHRVYS